MKTLQEKKIEKMEELIKLYEKELDRTATYLHVHNMSCSIEASEKGARLNKELAALDKEIEQGEKKKTLGDYDVWYKPCEKCGYDTGKSTIPKEGNKTCWKCGNFISRDYSERALKVQPFKQPKDGIKGSQKSEQRKSADFVQYVTNLLYNAYNDGKQQISKDLFDEWIEKEMENMSEFYASQSNDYPEMSDEELLHDIYERSDMQAIHNSDIYLQGFQAGLSYGEDKSRGNPDVCPDCGSGIYNCKCQ